MAAKSPLAHSAAISKSTAKRKPTPASWRKGQSGNPKGAPKRGESWAEVVTRVFNMTGAEVADYAMPLAKQLRTIGETVTLKEAVTLRVAVALMNEPTPGLFNAVMDRVEGSPRQSLEVTGDDDKPVAFRVVEIETLRAAVGVASVARRSTGDTETPG